MLKVVLAALIIAFGGPVALGDPAHEVPGASPSPATCVPSCGHHDSSGKLVVGTANVSGEQPPDESDHRTDYAARLRAAFHDEAKEAMVAREDAMGAAAEIEKLWVALWAMVDATKDVTSPEYRIWIEAIARIHMGAAEDGTQPALLDQSRTGSHSCR